MAEKPKITLQFPVVPSLRALLQSIAEAAANLKHDWGIDYLPLPLTDDGQAALVALLPTQKRMPSRICVSLKGFTLDTSGTGCSYRFSSRAYRDVHRAGTGEPIGNIEITALGDRSGSGVLTLYR